MLNIPFDPIEQAKDIEDAVIRDGKRKYYRFRAAPYYGGIATADAVGCCFLCAYCWNYFKILQPHKYGKFYSAEQFARKLINTAWKKQYGRCRITGCEPILGDLSFDHLVNVIAKVRQDDLSLTFILETNGLLLGLHPRYIDRLKISNASIRVALKGWDEISFKNITGVDGKYFEYPLLGIKKMRDEGLNAWPAVMWDTFGESGIKKLKAKLVNMGIETEVEVEGLERYPHVMENIEKRSVTLL